MANTQDWSKEQFPPVNETTVELNDAGTELTIHIPLQEAQASSRGKIMVIATTNGALRTKWIRKNGERIYLVVNAFYYPKPQERDDAVIFESGTDATS